MQSAESSVEFAGMPGRVWRSLVTRLRAGCTWAGAGGRQARIGRPEKPRNLRRGALQAFIPELNRPIPSSPRRSGTPGIGTCLSQPAIGSAR